MNGVDVLEMLSRMAADTSSTATWLKQLQIILILYRKICLVNKTKHLTPILAAEFVLLGKVVTQ